MKCQCLKLLKSNHQVIFELMLYTLVKIVQKYFTKCYVLSKMSLVVEIKQNISYLIWAGIILNDINFPQKCQILAISDASNPRLWI